MNNKNFNNNSYASGKSNKNVHICSITGWEYTGYGNNAWPYEGRCCDEANSMYVIPARLSGITPEFIKSFGGNESFRKIWDKAVREKYNK